LFGPAIINEFMNVLENKTEQLMFGEYYEL